MEKYLVGNTYVIEDDVTTNINLDLRCRDLRCLDLDYYAFAIAYNSFRCKTAKARRENGFHKCLDSEIEYIKDEPKETIKIGGVVFDKSEVGERLQGLDGL